MSKLCLLSLIFCSTLPWSNLYKIPIKGFSSDMTTSRNVYVLSLDKALTAYLFFESLLLSL